MQGFKKPVKAYQPGGNEEHKGGAASGGEMNTCKHCKRTAPFEDFTRHFTDKYRELLKQVHNIDIDNLANQSENDREKFLSNRDLGAQCSKCHTSVCKLCEMSPFHSMAGCQMMGF
jgi:hypothetical protein